jgi:AraC-like DNA-binding protein
LVLAAVPRERLRCLRAANAGVTLLPVEGWAQAVDAIRARPVEMAVVDPVLGGGPRTHEIERLRLLFPSLPLLIYTALTPEIAGVLLTLGRSGVRRALFHRFDDAPEALRAAIGEELDGSAAQRVLHDLRHVLRELPGPVRSAIEAMVDPEAAPGTVADLAREARLERRTFERWLERSGLPSPRSVLLGVRMLYAHRLLLDPGYTIEDVALKLGYGRVRTLQVHCKEVFGLTAGELRISLPASEAVAMVTSRCFAQRRWAAS